MRQNYVQPCVTIEFISSTGIICTSSRTESTDNIDLSYEDVSSTTIWQ